MRWRREVAEQEAAVAAGTLSDDEAYAARAWPPEFISGVDAALAVFERDVAALSDIAPDEAVWAAVEHVVLALNDIDAPPGHAIDTITREELCDHIDDVVAAAGIDVESLTARRDCAGGSLADEWRDW
ncbi:hypothetical protein [Catenuloplanes japonicus]|uniref:hypothetical protein n=1 Tax=Catenuloplanes japonicus TaxID=33876 RepID=UPI001E5CE915|nr:hypothetical protein [Catenuloplanes japonicus]